MGALTQILARLLYNLIFSISRAHALLSASKASLHTASFAKLHEAASLYQPNLEDLQTALLLGRGTFGRIASVRPTKTRRELGNILVCAPPRSGKSVHAISQLLTWEGSCIVNDVKGELHAATAGYRQTLGPVFVIDPQGFGSQLDPLEGKQTEDEIYSAATHLLYEAHEGEGKIFTLRAIKMLQVMFLASRIEGVPPFPYIRFLIQSGLADTVSYLYSVAPSLAKRFLETDPEEADLTDKFLQSCWGTLTSRLTPLLNETVIRSLMRSDFAIADLMCGDKPITIYLKLNEQDLLALSPLVRLFWTSAINTLTTTYDKRQGRGCKPVLLLIDEGGRTAIPSLHDAVTTVCGRGISIWLVIQSLSQLSAVYGHDRAKIIIGNCDTQLFYRPKCLDTARYLEEYLGNASGYSRSQTLHKGEEKSEGLSERPVPLLSKTAILQLKDTDVLVWHHDYRPLRLKRMEWWAFGLLKQRHSLKAPPLKPLPPLTDTCLPAGKIKLSLPQALPVNKYPETEDDVWPVELDNPDNLPLGRQDLADSLGGEPTTVWQKTNRTSNV